MRLIRTLYKDTIPSPGCVLTIGNYDAIHVGHQKILNQLEQKGCDLGLPVVVMTFLPGPDSYFNPGNAAPRLTSVTSRYLSLRKFGVDVMLVLPFNRRLAQTSAEDFIQKFLFEGLNTKYILIGDDFRFGAGRKGDYPMLKRSESEYGFKVDQIATIMGQDSRVSSTRIRQSLAEGNLKLTRDLLGKNYTIVGRVAHGEKRGRQWGYPTLNIPVRNMPPFMGVFAVRMRVSDGEFIQGVANLGKRPTVDGLKMLLEIHLFNFDSDIYGQRVCVEFIEKIRNEQKFDSLDELKTQIGRDCDSAMNIFESVV